jgi:hypothetical protein
MIPTQDLLALIRKRTEDGDLNWEATGLFDLRGTLPDKAVTLCLQTVLDDYPRLKLTVNVKELFAEVVFPDVDEGQNELKALYRFIRHPGPRGLPVESEQVIAKAEQILRQY